MTRAQLAAALHHVARLAGPVTDPHRLELESILLKALAVAEMAEIAGNGAWRPVRALSRPS